MQIEIDSVTRKKVDFLNQILNNAVQYLRVHICNDELPMDKLHISIFIAAPGEKNKDVLEPVGVFASPNIKEVKRMVATLETDTDQSINGIYRQGDTYFEVENTPKEPL